MIHRTAMFVAIVMLAGCQSGPATIPPPGTGSVNTPNPYYQQPPATPTFQSPSYGAAANTAPNFGPRPNVSLANTPSDGLAWQPVTKPPAIGQSNPSNINPQTTLTTIRGTNSPAAPAATRTASAAGLRDITELPMVPVQGVTPPATAPLRPGVPAATATYTPPAYTPPTAASAITTPNFAPVPTATRAMNDPWRGR